MLRVPVEGGTPTLVAAGHVFGPPLLTTTSLIVSRGNAFPNNDADDAVALPLAGGTPTVLQAGDLIAGPVTDGTLVYLMTAEGVRTVSLASASPSDTIFNTTIFQTVHPSQFLPLDGRFVVLTPPGWFERLIPPPEGDGILTILASGPPSPSSLVRCGASACWSAGNAIMRGDPISGALTQVVNLRAELAQTSSLVFDGATFFIVGSSTSDAPPDRILAAQADGSRLSVLVQITEAAAIAVDDECLYWASRRGIFSVAKVAPGPVSE